MQMEKLFIHPPLVGAGDTKPVYVLVRSDVEGITWLLCWECFFGWELDLVL